MRHTEFSLRRPVTVFMIFAALAALGVVSAQLLLVEQFPDIEYPGFFVFIPYEGSTPEETERLVTRPVEEALATLPGVKHMYSSSNEGSAQIWMDYGFNSNAATEAVEARVKLDSIRDELPAEIRRIQVFSGSMNDEPIVNLRISSERDLGNEYLMLHRLVKRRLERIDGVSKVELQGVEPPEVLILLDAGRIAAHKIDLGELSTLLDKSNFSVSAGKLTESGRRWSLRPNGEFLSVNEVAELVINERGLRLGDIAKVSLQPRQRDYGRHLDGQYAIGIAISKATGANMVEVAGKVMAEVEKVSALPQMRGINIFTLENSADAVKQSLSDLIKAGLVGSFLAIIVLYIFLRQLSTTLIVMLAIPLSLLITLSALYFAGMTLNILTLMGLMLAVGMLVDNSVVITESIFRTRQLSTDDATVATVSGVREVGLAVMASTLTSICVFLPIVFGEAIDIMVFLWHVGVTISVAIVSSLVIAQTLIPLLASRIAPPPIARSTSVMSRVTDAYARALEWTLAHPGWATSIAIVVLASAYVPYKTEMLKFDMFPQEASRRLIMPYHIKGVHPVERTEAAVNTIEAYLFENREALDIRSVYSYFSKEEATTVILLTDEDDAIVSARNVMERIEKDLPVIAIGEPSFDWDQQGGGEGFTVTLRGDSTEQLQELTDAALRRLRTVDALDSLRSDLTTGEREIQIRVDRDRAAAFGLSSRDVANFVNIGLRGRDLREFRTEEGEIAMRISFRNSDRQTIDQLAQLNMFAPDGTTVQLRAVAELRERAGPSVVRRTDRNTAVKISGSVNQKSSMDSVKEDVSLVLDQMAWPTGYSWSFGASVERNDETQRVLMQNILLGVVLIFIVMAALFESVLYPISIMMSLIYSIVGAVWFLALTGTTMSFMAMIGIMILIGVVVNNGIVLVDHINNLRTNGMNRHEAIIGAARDRLKPILMTVCTTVLGLTPLAVGTTQIGADGPAYFPMARAIIGGLAFSTVTSLLLVPLTYAGLDTMKNWVGRVRGYAQRGPAAAEA